MMNKNNDHDENSRKPNTGNDQRMREDSYDDEDDEETKTNKDDESQKNTSRQ